MPLIVMDVDEQWGQLIVTNEFGAVENPPRRFRRQPIGSDPDFRIHISDRLLEIHDGPFLELGLKGIVGQMIQLPQRREDRPNPDRLAFRFEQFKKCA